jgi:predicted enzyme related to lactoylglutathione lyase
MAKNFLSHFEWSSTDLERTKTFLEGLFGWKIKSWSDNYMVIYPPEGPDGGIMKVDKVEPGKSPCIYIEVDDIEPYLEKAVELGGKIDVPKTEIPKVGWYAHILDFDGNTIGIMQYAER